MLLVDNRAADYTGLTPTQDMFKYRIDRLIFEQPAIPMSSSLSSESTTAFLREAPVTVGYGASIKLEVHPHGPKSADRRTESVCPIDRAGILNVFRVQEIANIDGDIPPLAAPVK